jgi:hypothetical protein
MTTPAAGHPTDAASTAPTPNTEVTSMTKALLIAALLSASAAHAQTARPSLNDGLVACLRLPDGTRARLDCFDAVIAPLAKSRPSSRDVADCRYYTEQDQRLACFDDFAHSIPRYSNR